MDGEKTTAGRLPEAELAVMLAVWRCAPPVTTARVMLLTDPERGWKTSTVISFLDRLKNRGFLSKLVMTPVPPSKLLAGKALAINILVTGSSLVTFFFLFLSSWLNRSNDVGSLLPFGLLLMPDQLIQLFS